MVKIWNNNAKRRRNVAVSPNVFITRQWNFPFSNILHFFLDILYRKRRLVNFLGSYRTVKTAAIAAAVVFSPDTWVLYRDCQPAPAVFSYHFWHGLCVVRRPKNRKKNIEEPKRTVLLDNQVWSTATRHNQKTCFCLSLWHFWNHFFSILNQSSGLSWLSRHSPSFSLSRDNRRVKKVRGSLFDGSKKDKQTEICRVSTRVCLAPRWERHSAAAAATGTVSTRNRRLLSSQQVGWQGGMEEGPLKWG